VIVARETSDFFSSSGSDAIVTLVRVVAILVVALVVRALAHRVIRRTVRGISNGRAYRFSRHERTVESAPLLTERRRQRADTIGSVLRSGASIVILTIAFSTILGELGFDLAPVLASAGILGVAIGFGAQNLVKDFLNGIFMLLEDQYGVGDAIDAGEATGIVEAVALRTTRLRSVDGTVWHIRNGEISRIGNQSQGWSRALLDISVAYDSDVDEASAVIKAVADEVWHDEAFGLMVLDEPEVWGVEDLGIDGIAIRLVVKTVPLEQWKIARELRRRLKSAFDEHGIEIPFPQRSLWLRTEPDGPAQPVREAAKARTAAVQAASQAASKAAASKAAAARGPAKAPVKKPPSKAARTEAAVKRAVTRRKSD
jgi:small conductance mechanosensitive channel